MFYRLLISILMIPLGCFGGATPTTPAQAKPLPQEADTAVMATRDEERIRKRAAAGTTVFTGPQGATGTAAIQAKTLFGN